MNVGELKRLLENLDDEMEVRIAHQPSWPLQYTVSDLVECAVFDEEDLEDDEENDTVVVPEGSERIAYIVESSQVYDDPYLPYSVRAAIGWG